MRYPDCEPLRDFLEPAAGLLDPFELGKMRYKWRQWAVYPCNWKTAIEAFMEPYHVAGTHTQLLKYGEYYAYSKAHGIHSVSGFDERDPSRKNSQSSSVTRVGKGSDPRISTYELIRENYETVNYSCATDTLVNAEKRQPQASPCRGLRLKRGPGCRVLRLRRACRVGLHTWPGRLLFRVRVFCSVRAGRQGRALVRPVLRWQVCWRQPSLER